MGQGGREKLEPLPPAEEDVQVVVKIMVQPAAGSCASRGEACIYELSGGVTPERLPP